MTTYIIRRLLLMIPTFILATALAFTVLQLVPSGPYEEELMKLHSQLMMSGEAGGMGVSDVGSAPGEIPEEAKQMIKEYYGLDKPAVVRYFNWLGLWPKEMEQNLVTFKEGQSIAEYRLGFENYLRVEKNGDNTAIVYENIENEWVESDAWKTKLGSFD